MREIKFRAKAMSKKIVGWHYGLVRSIANDGTGFLQDQHRNCVHINTYTLGQYTGLKDKNGKEIYEGDILITKDTEGEKYQTCVIYENGMFLSGEESLYDDVFLFEAEVIGNIYENPELLTSLKYKF